MLLSLHMMTKYNPNHVVRLKDVLFNYIYLRFDRLLIDIRFTLQVHDIIMNEKKNKNHIYVVKH